MNKSKPICFVIMGFGKKYDPYSKRTIDLDATYHKIIAPAINKAGCLCIRADEIIESGLIDRSMYALLYYADVVIADITTMNPNALYELGVRHAMKDASTITIMESGASIPFDINHDRIMNYSHLGDEISDAEATNCINRLVPIIQKALKEKQVDSPVYTYLPSLTKPSLSEEEIKAIIGELKENENTVYALTERAKQYMAESDFAAAESLWRKLSEKVENDIFYKQQRALCKYKSEKPNANIACTEAIKIIGSIKNQLDPETLGIEGAIYKKLWRLTQYNDCLEKATECYKKSWELYHDYYPGENYAVCMIDKSQQEKDPNEKIHHIVEAKHTFNTIIENLEALLKNPEIDALMWKYATLSNCYYGIKEEENAAKYESMFRGMNPEGWEIESFSETKEKLQKWISDGII